MKTTSFPRTIIVMAMIIAVACSEPVVEPSVPPKPVVVNPIVVAAVPVEYHTNVTTWTHAQNGNCVGLITRTPGTNLANVEVFVVKDGQRIAIDRQLDPTNLKEYQSLYGEYYWVSYQNNVLLLHYMGASGATPPFPLDVLIVY